mgnify:CR=1 FL=1
MFNRKLKKQIVELQEEMADIRATLRSKPLLVVDNTEVKPSKPSKPSKYGRWVDLFQHLNSEANVKSVEVFSSKAEAKLAQVGVVSAAQRYGQKYMSRRKARTVTFTRIA